MSKQELLARIEELRVPLTFGDSEGAHQWDLACKTLIFSPELRAALADAPDEEACAKVLLDVEYINNGTYVCCPWCNVIQELGHDPTCVWQAALASRKPAPSEFACAAVLRKIEWIDTGTLQCPECQWLKGCGHKPGCELAAALREISTHPVQVDCKHHGMQWTADVWGKQCPMCVLEDFLHQAIDYKRDGEAEDIRSVLDDAENYFTRRDGKPLPPYDWDSK